MSCSKAVSGVDLSVATDLGDFDQLGGKVTVRLTDRDRLIGPAAETPSDPSGKALEEDGGVAARVAAAAIRQVSKRGLRSRGLKSLRPLYSSLVKLRQGSHGARSFWTSKCVVLQTTRDDLARLNRLVEESLIGDVYPNRMLHVPRQALSALERKAARTRAFLEAVLESPPRWLQASRAFVAEATGAQSSIIARSPHFKAIRLNRRLR